MQFGAQYRSTLQNWPIKGLSVSGPRMDIAGLVQAGAVVVFCVWPVVMLGAASLPSMSLNRIISVLSLDAHIHLELPTEQLWHRVNVARDSHSTRDPDQPVGRPRNDWKPTRSTALQILSTTMCHGTRIARTNINSAWTTQVTKEERPPSECDTVVGLLSEKLRQKSQTEISGL